MANDKFDRRQTSSETFLENKENPVPLRLVGPYGKVPNWKCIDFWMGGFEGTNPVGTDNLAKRQNWRSNAYGNIDFSGHPVNDNILLIPEGMTLEVSGGQSLADVNESLGKSDDFLAILSEATAIITGSMSVPQWKPKVLDGLNPLKLAQGFKFNFHYGAGGLYDAFEEVVKPIYALVGFFGVKTTNGAASPIISTSDLPYPTKGLFMFNKLKGAVSGVADLMKNGLEGKSASEKLADANAKLQAALASGAYGIASSSRYHNLWISWGRFTLGPFQYSEIKYSFDMSMFDSNGWPMNGTFEINGLESMRVSSSSAMTSPVIVGA